MGTSDQSGLPGTKNQAAGKPALNGAEHDGYPKEYSGGRNAGESFSDVLRENSPRDFRTQEA